MRTVDHAIDAAFSEEYLFSGHRHPTTIACSELLVRQAAERPLGRVLDVGTGDGCLALAAADLGALEVVAVERERAQHSRAISNLVRAGLDRRIDARHCDVSTLVPEVDGDFDVILANLWGNELIAQAGVLARLLRPGGTLIASGTLLWQAGAVRAAFEAAGLLCKGLHASSGWAALLLGHAASPPSASLSGAPGASLSGAPSATRLGPGATPGGGAFRDGSVASREKA